MSREVEDKLSENFPPLVGLRNKGNFVLGVVQKIGETKTGNPVVTLKLVDLDGSTSRQVSKGKYEEVVVDVGDSVQVVGSVLVLRNKLASLNVGDIVRITSEGKASIGHGKTKYSFKIVIYDSLEEAGVR